MANQIDVYVYNVIPASPVTATSTLTFDKVFHVGIPVQNAVFREINSIFGTDLSGMPQIYGEIIYSVGGASGGNLQIAYVMNTVAQLLAKANA